MIMANYYYVTIESDKMTQEVASKILQEMASKNYIRSFNFYEGYLTYNTRGLTDITTILEEAGFVDEEIKVKDEFELAYESFTEEEIRAMGEENKEMEEKILKGFEF